eukprot:163882-Chlamydomonas_euryale.AAC.1
MTARTLIANRSTTNLKLPTCQTSPRPRTAARRTADLSRQLPGQPLISHREPRTCWQERERAEREQSKLRSTCTQVLVASIGSGLQV